nr:hypothetical protein [Mycobacterium pseudoshottsii]
AEQQTAGPAIAAGAAALAERADPTGTTGPALAEQQTAGAAIAAGAAGLAERADPTGTTGPAVAEQKPAGPAGPAALTGRSGPAGAAVADKQAAVAAGLPGARCPVPRWYRRRSAGVPAVPGSAH